MVWTVETVSAVDAEIEALPVKLRARLIRLLETVENTGLQALRAPHVKSRKTPRQALVTARERMKQVTL